MSKVQRKVENMKIMGVNWNHKLQNHPVFGFSKLLYCYIVTLEMQKKKVFENCYIVTLEMQKNGFSKL